MATIFNTLKRVSGAGVPGVTVTVSLDWDTSVSPVVKTTNGETFISRPGITYTDGSGDWSMEVTPNADLEPTSVYRIEETYSNEDETTEDSHPVTHVYYIEVPASANPAWVGDLIVNTPAWRS